MCESLKTRFVGTDRVKMACLATLKGEFDKLYMADGKTLDDYTGKISSMAAKYADLGSTLDDAEAAGHGPRLAVPEMVGIK